MKQSGLIPAVKCHHSQGSAKGQQFQVNDDPDQYTTRGIKEFILVS
jgi:hypothetical protein